MATVLAPDKPLTAEDLLNQPDDSLERWIIRGELKEFPMTKRNRFHSVSMARVAYALNAWMERTPRPHGAVVVGECAFRLVSTPETSVGVDVAYVSPEHLARTPDEALVFEGAPLLAVEILSPSDTMERIHEKLQVYLSTGSKLVWLLDPELVTVTVFETGKQPIMVNREQILSAEPYLPGFTVPVEQLFN